MSGSKPRRQAIRVSRPPRRACAKPLSMAGVARSALSPQVNGSLSIQRQKWADNVYYGPGPLAGEQSWNNTGTLGLSYHLDIWGKDRNAAERALDAAHASAADARAAQLELEGNVVRTYIEMSLNYALLDIAKATLQQQQQIVDLANASSEGRHRHAARSEPGRNADAGIRAPDRRDRRKDRARPQPARRAGRQGSGRGRRDPAPDALARHAPPACRAPCPPI